MFIKTFMLHSLTYIVGIASALAVHQAVSLPLSPAMYQSDAMEAATNADQTVNRSAKRDRLPIRKIKSPANDRALPHLQGQNAPNPRPENDCTAPIDVLGRCFANAEVNREVT